jgi:hypothetical protein
MLPPGLPLAVVALPAPLVLAAAVVALGEEATAGALPAGRVAAAAEPLAVVAAAAAVGAVVGAPPAVVAGFGVSVALPPQAARIAAATLAVRPPSKERRVSPYRLPFVPSIVFPPVPPGSRCRSARVPRLYLSLAAAMHACRRTHAASYGTLVAGPIPIIHYARN